MADQDGAAEGGSNVVPPGLRARVAPLLELLSSCEPAASDDLLLYFHTAIDAAIGHAHSTAAFSTALQSHANTVTRLVKLLASSITPPTPPAATFNALLAPLPSALSSPLALALTTRHAALHTAALHAATAITPSYLASFDYSVRLITSSSHIATLNQPTTLLTLHRHNSAAAATAADSVSVELSVEQLDRLLSKMDEVAKLLQTIG